MSEVSTSRDDDESLRIVRQRRAHRKVKTGCIACKVRRQKCGEQRPTCAGCCRFATPCLYKDAEKAIRRSRRPATALISSPLVPRSELPALQDPSQPEPFSDDINIEDLGLLHHYMTSTSITTAQLPEATRQEQVAVPNLAKTYRFVMRLILAKAAIHLSWLSPSQQSYYTTLAAKHHRAALPEFRSSLGNLTQQNHWAVIIYAKGLVWSSFAWFEPFSNVKIAGNHSADTWLPDWFSLLRGSCAVVEKCRKWIQDGLYILPPPLPDLSEFHASSDSQRLLSLISQMTTLVHDKICTEVLDTLLEAFARASMVHQNTPLRNAMNFWVGSLPNEFIRMLENKEQWSLVVMAHFCILVHRSETRWFMRGHAIECLGTIVSALTPTWKPFTQWPCQEVGLCNEPI